MVHVALLEPEIAPNAGSVARTCLATGATLHLIRPLGFRLDDASLARAGMDYWDRAEIRIHESYARFVERHAAAYGAGRVHGFTSRADVRHSLVAYLPGDILLFGPESRGLPDEILREVGPVRIPMRPEARSLNLAVAVAIGVYEALRPHVGAHGLV